MSEKYLVNPSPHYRCGDTTPSIMRDVIISMLPVLGGSVVFFGCVPEIVKRVALSNCLC